MNKHLFFIFFTLLFVQKNLASQIGNRIIGGSDAHASQFSYAAAIYTHRTDGSYFCGGIILDNQWILTAAQCVINATQFTIQIGSTSLSETDKNRVKLSTSTWIAHPDFNPQTLENDLGLIKLRLPITFTSYIRAIDMLPASDLYPSSSTVALGWGQTTDETSGLVDKLQFVQVSTITNDECKLTYGDQITDKMACAEGNYNEGICNGDIGGPLIEYHSRGINVVVGIASFISGEGCEQPHPSGYTRVYPYVDWITSVMASA